jgi:hypothetical protein
MSAALAAQPPGRHELILCLHANNGGYLAPTGQDKGADVDIEWTRRPHGQQ